MKKEVLKPSPQLLIKLGSIIVHYEEWTSKTGHELDKVAIDSLMSDDEVKEWMKEMNEMAFLPQKR
jgi:hypothetical protein